jgi:poly-gamma-glutamate capsule biosynthesis protein CapA/YwtB (metallophosphatase superfamily)
LTNKSYRGPRARRRQALIRRRIRMGAAGLGLIGIVVLAILLIRGAVSGGEDRPLVSPIVSAAASALPAASESPAISAEPSAEPSVEPSMESSAAPEAAAPATARAESPAAGGLRTAHMRVVGDIMFHKEQLSAAKKSDGTYDFELQFRFVKDSLAAADYTIANLETTVGQYKNMGYSGYPQFNTPESVLETLKDCGIDFFTLANNHMLDRWFDGLINDVDLVEKYGFHHVGAYRTKAERGAPVIYDVKGIKIGFVAYTHTTNTMENSSDKAAQEYGVPYLYKADIEGDIQRLRDAGAELVIALPHWGTENVNMPDETQIKYAKRLAKAGADIILGSHSHMVQPIQVAEGVDADGRPKQVFAIYSLGNFISAMTMQYTDSGIILDFTIQEQPDGSFRVEDIGYVPVYVWKQDGKYAVIPSGKFLKSKPDGMSVDQYNQMVKTYHEIVDQLGADEFTVLAE